MKLSERLQIKIKEDTGFEVELPRRLPRSRWQACAGGWAWAAKFKNYAGDIGSEDTMKDCVTCGKLKAVNSERHWAWQIYAGGGDDK